MAIIQIAKGSTSITKAEVMKTLQEDMKFDLTEAEAIYAKIDVNNDGTVSKSEITSIGNNDSKLTKAELKYVAMSDEDKALYSEGVDKAAALMEDEPDYNQCLIDSGDNAVEAQKLYEKQCEEYATKIEEAMTELLEPDKDGNVNTAAYEGFVSELGSSKTSLNCLKTAAENFLEKQIEAAGTDGSGTNGSGASGMDTLITMVQLVMQPILDVTGGGNLTKEEIQNIIKEPSLDVGSSSGGHNKDENELNIDKIRLMWKHSDETDGSGDGSGETNSAPAAATTGPGDNTGGPGHNEGKGD